MNEKIWLQSHVLHLLREIWQVCEVRVDDEGDALFRQGTAIGWVTVREAGDLYVDVMARAVDGLRPSAKLLRELNSIQLRASTANVALLECGSVMVSQTLHSSGVCEASLRQALGAVSGIADDIGTLLAAVYDGHTPFAADVETDEDAM